MKIAIHTLEVPILPTPAQDIPRLQAAGVTAFEAGDRFFLTHSEQAIEEKARLYREAGIRLWSVHAPFNGRNDLSAPDPDERRYAVEVHKWFLERIALAQAPVTIIHPGVRALESEIAPRIPRLLASLEELLPVAERLKIRLALENLPPAHPGCDFTQLRRVIEKFDSPWLRVCFDSGHAHMAGGVGAGMLALSDLICTFHLHDNDGQRDLHLQPPYGSIPWDEFRTVFDRMHFADPVVVEARPWAKSGYAQQLREVEALLTGQMLQLEAGGAPARVQCARCGHFRFGPSDAAWCACPPAR